MWELHNTWGYLRLVAGVSIIVFSSFQADVKSGVMFQIIQANHNLPIPRNNQSNTFEEVFIVHVHVGVNHGVTFLRGKKFKNFGNFHIMMTSEKQERGGGNNEGFNPKISKFCTIQILPSLL